MKRIASGTVLVVALVTGALFATGAASSGGGSGYQVRAIFDDVASAVPGEDVKIAGAKVGKISSLGITPDNKAAIGLEIDSAGFTPFHQDASCTIRP